MEKSGTSGVMELRAPDTGTLTRQVFKRRQRDAPPRVAHSWSLSGWGCRATTGRLRVLSWRMMRFWYSASVAADSGLYAQAHVPKRRSHYRETVPRVFQCWLPRHEELVGFLGSAVDFFEEVGILAGD